MSALASSTMESGTKVDRLSNLPDDLIYKILSYIDIKYAIRLSFLSSRWRSIRASMPNLNFLMPRLKLSRYEQLSKSSGYHEFVNDVLSARNNKIDVSSVSLHLPVRGDAELSVDRILDYAFSHNVQKLTISIRDYYFFPSRLKSKSLKHLRLIGRGTSIYCGSDSLPWDLPALITLRLHHVSLRNCSSLLATCQNVKNLTLKECKVLEYEYYNDSTIINGFTITNPQLRSLTLKKVEWYVDFVHVDTPQLKNLIFVDTPYENYTGRISGFPGELTISARDLTYLRIKGSYFPKLFLDGCRSLEKVDLCISSPQKTNVHRISDVFQRLHSVKSLALSLEIVELLSTSEEVISHQPSPFPSLKSLKIYPLQGLKTWPLVVLNTRQLKSSLEIFPTDEEQEAMEIKLSAEVTNYLLGSSSNATFTMVSHEEARAIKITTVAYRLMAALWEILEKIEAYTTDTKRAKWMKTLADSNDRDFRRQIRPPRDTKELFRTLQNLKLLLTKVLASKRVEMQACFSRLCAKTKIIVISGYFDEIASSS